MKKIIVTTAVIVFSMAIIAYAAPDSNSIVQYGIGYYIQTDKSIYDLGENIEMLFGVTNLMDEDVTISCSVSPEFNFYVQEDGETVWMKVHNFYGYSPGIDLSIGESVELSHIWDMIDDTESLVEPGVYNVVGVMYNQPWNYYVNNGEYIPTEVAVQITIVPEPATTYYVNATEGSDNNDGLSPNTAFATIQKAIDSAFDGDTVLVADGTYTGPGNRDIDFLGKAVTVQSENGPENCIIDCNGTESDEHRGFYFHSSEDANSILDGFTITNGYATHGGAIYCRYSSPTITNCVITDNIAYFGGGILSYYGSPKITNCTISSNSGSGICCWKSNANITNCTITGNTGQPNLDGTTSGGGICCSKSSPTINNCNITGNTAGAYGGAIYGCDGPITNCTITSNSAEDSGGGLVFCRGPITNCTITGNSTNGSGGGLAYCHGPITNCIIWDNWTEQIHSRSPTVTYSNVQGGWEGEGNIDDAPCFVEPGYWANANDANIIVEPNDPNAVWLEGDYHLLPDSPCIDAGDPNYIPEPNETDLDGNPRVNGGRIDMGAYETIMHEARLLIWPRVINRKSRQPRIMAWLRLPQRIAKDQIDRDVPLILYPGVIKAVRQFVFQNRRRGARRTSIFAFFDKAVLMDAVATNGPVQLMVLGHLLKPGQYFYGSDTVRIMARRLPRRPLRRRR